MQIKQMHLYTGMIYMICNYHLYVYMCMHTYILVQAFGFRERGSGSGVSRIVFRGWGAGSHNLDLGLVSGIDE